MYSAFTLDAYQLWRPRSPNVPRIHDDSSGHLRTRPPQSEPHPFAPPLAAYLADECGPNSAYTDHNAAMEQAYLSGASDIPLLGPTTLQRLDKLRKIRATGYTTIVPIGIGRTMAQMDQEAGEEAENLLACERSHALPVEPIDNAESDLEELGDLSGLDSLMAADLDADVVDADEADVFSSGGLTPDAFMAADVEYQADHSLDEVERVPTLPTTVSAGRRCDDSDVDMTFD